MEKFHYETNGYNKKEVNDFIKRVIKETEGIINKCEEQKDKIKVLEEQLNTYRRVEETLKQSLINAEKTSDDLKKVANERANIIISDAKNDASRIINDALLRAEKIDEQTDILERNIKIFKRKLKIIVEQQLAVVEEIEVLDLEK
ncbi:MAG: DivIVA domain-containing protein [bacterium]|jgi:complete genome|nr:DivIVA domain-containing protein [bacterium]